MIAEELLEKIGQQIANELNLKPDMDYVPPRYHLRGGTKTNIGLTRTIQRIFGEHGYTTIKYMEVDHEN